MTRRLGTAAAMAGLAAGLGGCGYTMVKRSDIQGRRAADSASVASLESQLTTLTARCREDSARYAALTATRPAPAAPVTAGTAADSVVKVRDEEIAALKDQLTKAQDELERIKRRLASPRP